MCKFSNFIIFEIFILLLIFSSEIYNTFSKTFMIRIFFIEKLLDVLCKIISKQIPNIRYTKRLFIKTDSIVISTRLQKGGGLGKIIENITSKNNSEIILTNLIKYNQYQSNFIKSKVHNINNIGLLNKIFALNELIISNKLSKIHILNDPSDPIPYIAFLRYKKSNKKFIFHHHCDSCYSFGMYESKWNHEDYFQNQYVICRKKLKPKLNHILDIL